MKITLKGGLEREWKVYKIGVIGPGIVGMPMAALLADANIKIGTDQPAKVIVVQRNSENSGWKVESINKGKSVIGGIEPGLNDIVEKNVKDGYLSASWDYGSLIDADVILVSIQTDKDGLAPDYGPLFGGLTNLAEALQKKPDHIVPLIIFESTLAPSSMATVIKEHFAKYNLIDGENILLGNSPNRVMPGRLVERVTDSDKLVAGLNVITPQLIKHLYSNIVKRGTLYATNSLTAEVVKTLENAYRDVRIAFSAEIVRYCDENNIDFYKVRDQVNVRLAQTDNASTDSNTVPSGGLLIPTVGVGGHCLPKDGILLWWRKIESGAVTKNSLILKSRIINDESPAETIKLFERNFGPIAGKKITILGTAYRFNSEDTRNSPSIQLALLLLNLGCKVILHDPYVKQDDQNLSKFKLNHYFTNNLEMAVNDTDYIFIGTAHKIYIEKQSQIVNSLGSLKGILDACNIYKIDDLKDLKIKYTGIGRGLNTPDKDFIDFVFESFHVFEKGLANEVSLLCDFLNGNYADGDFNRVLFTEVQKLAGSCSTGCVIADTGKITEIPVYKGFSSRLVIDAYNSQFSK